MLQVKIDRNGTVSEVTVAHAGEPEVRNDLVLMATWRSLLFFILVTSFCTKFKWGLQAGPKWHIDDVPALI